MILNVFDDRRGTIAHVLAGIISFFFPIIFVIFIFYEIVEHIYLAGKEREANFLGDIVEYLFGLGCVSLVVRILCG